MPLDKEEREYWQNIVDTIADNVRMLEGELKQNFSPKIKQIINKNLRARRGQLRYYRDLLKDYEELEF